MWATTCVNILAPCAHCSVTAGISMPKLATVHTECKPTKMKFTVFFFQGAVYVSYEARCEDVSVVPTSPACTVTGLFTDSTGPHTKLPSLSYSGQAYLV